MPSCVVNSKTTVWGLTHLSEKEYFETLTSLANMCLHIPFVRCKFSVPNLALPNFPPAMKDVAMKRDRGTFNRS